jgi:c-di-AMP phosphodiesterase-like protein
MYAFDLNHWVKRYSNTEFILLFLFVFFVLSVIVSFVKFASQWPVLVVVSFVVAFVIYNAFSGAKEQDPYYRDSKAYVENVWEEKIDKLKEGMEIIQAKDEIRFDSLLFQADDTGEGEDDTMVYS